MDTIETGFQEMQIQADSEFINRIAIHEAGHFVMMLLLMREAPYHIAIVPETGAGMTMPFRLPELETDSALVTMAGYAAEKIYNPAEADMTLGEYISYDDHDNQIFLNMCRSRNGTTRLSEDSYLLELKSFQDAVCMLKKYKALVLLLAHELQSAENLELNYDAIQCFCKENREALPILNEINFPTPSPPEKKNLRKAIAVFRRGQNPAMNFLSGRPRKFKPAKMESVK